MCELHLNEKCDVKQIVSLEVIGVLWNLNNSSESLVRNTFIFNSALQLVFKTVQTSDPPIITFQIFKP